MTADLRPIPGWISEKIKSVCIYKTTGFRFIIVFNLIFFYLNSSKLGILDWDSRVELIFLIVMGSYSKASLQL